MRAAFCWLGCAFAFTLYAQSNQSLEVGFEERVRSEEWNNIIDHNRRLDDFRTQFRFRTRLWAQYSLPHLDLHVGLLNENRKTTHGATPYNGREVLFETLYADWRCAPNLSIRLGRQNIMRGDNFLLCDGTPLDGSRTAYYNALNMAYRFPKEAVLEFMAIANNVNDDYLPVINKIKNPAEMNRLVEWDERAVGLYFTAPLSTSRVKTQLDAYYFYKSESDFDTRLKLASAQPDRAFNTLGARVAPQLPRGFAFSAEGAYQWGNEVASGSASDRPIRAWGAYVKGSKRFEESRWKPRLSLGYVSLSGQNPTDNSRLTAWNPVFARWPKWSELYIYSQIPEKAPAYWTNSRMLECELRLSPLSSLDIRASYYRLLAHHPLASQPGAVLGTGTDRGQMWQARVDYRPHPQWKTHAVYEYLKPGDAYAVRDKGYYLRFECSFMMKKLFKL